MAMNLMGFFKSPQNELEVGGRVSEPILEISKACPICNKATVISELWENMNVCACGYHYRMNARQRIAMISESFEEILTDVQSENKLDFPGYDKKLEIARINSHENEGVVCGRAKVGDEDCMMFIMEPDFMMGSMGTVVGEKITKTIEIACEEKLPVVGFAVSGGARMQEGILSLMQMAKTSAAVKKHSDAGLLYIVVLTDPTTGGVTASFAMEADIIIAEPSATVGFAGRRVIEQTIRKKLPNEFQKAEFLLEHGFCDKILSRQKQKKYIKKLIQMHKGGF